MTTRSCTTCQCPLPSATDADGKPRCPECGTVDPIGSANPKPGLCMQCGYDLSGTPVRGDGVAWVCPECRYVSRIEDWHPTPKSLSPDTNRHGRWLMIATLLNIFVLGPVVTAAVFMLGNNWPFALLAALGMFVFEGMIFERADSTRLHLQHRRPAHVAKWITVLIACALVGYLVVALVWTVPGRLRP
ncbi:MAG: hypothetical protein QM783_12970 [Phycisphaerales bacterium]